MKIILLLGFIAAASAAAIHVASSGASSQFRTEDNIGNYNFGYDESHATGGTFRRESGNAAGQVVGSYGLRDADGRQRTVNYVADAAGYRASVSSNEPGVEPKDPAAVSINKAAIVAAPAVAIAAPAAPWAVAAPAVIAAPAAPWAPAAPIAVAAPVPVSSYSSNVVHGGFAAPAHIVSGGHVAAAQVIPSGVSYSSTVNHGAIAAAGWAPAAVSVNVAGPQWGYQW